MNIKDSNNSNVHISHLPSQRTVLIDNRLLHVGNIVYYPNRANNAKILKISAEGDVAIQFYVKGFPTCRFTSNLLRLETSNPYTVTGQLF